MWCDAQRQGYAVPSGRDFHDREEFLVLCRIKVFAIMETRHRCGPESTPGHGTAGDESWQTTQLAAMAAAGRDTPQTHFILGRSPSAPNAPQGPNAPQ
jgi:hypothetical protein